jgi:hypothetical protein
MLREAALIVVHHVRKSITRFEIGSAFRGSSALHAVGDSYMLLTRPSPQLSTVELRFQFRYAAAQPPRLLQLDPQTLWFSSSGQPPAAETAAAQSGKSGRDASSDGPWRSRRAIANCASKSWIATECSKRTAQLAISEACQQGWIVQDNGQYRLPL